MTAKPEKAMLPNSDIARTAVRIDPVKYLPSPDAMRITKTT
eukprot:CAMPEP_0202807308 /NCGR_PEP_ID=MMETSP1389-20130828/6_1 /ASSEMBLY_ACC=CAM_ASM_000865 /TAXON_ID=302021 /ORGANISM="Rhodomonas sp., Strain CCMP768" /LENGTH=40 /DNA_ID= /DNA_START= /DNA_END= /DNA_ORIENTATION=